MFSALATVKRTVNCGTNNILVSGSQDPSFSIRVSDCICSHISTCYYITSLVHTLTFMLGSRELQNLCFLICTKDTPNAGKISNVSGLLHMTLSISILIYSKNI